MKRTSVLVPALIAAVISGCTSAAAPSAADKSLSTGRATSAAKAADSVRGASALQGTWRSAPLTEAEVVSWYGAAGGEAEDLNGTKYPSVTAAGEAFFAQLGNGAHQYAVITITFQSGYFSEFESGDGGPAVQGDSQTYTVSGGRILTLTSNDPPPCVGTYTFTITGRQLRMHVLKQCANQLAGPFPTTLYASFPFTKVS